MQLRDSRTCIGTYFEVSFDSIDTQETNLCKLFGTSAKMLNSIDTYTLFPPPMSKKDAETQTYRVFAIGHH